MLRISVYYWLHSHFRAVERNDLTGARRSSGDVTTVTYSCTGYADVAGTQV